jgi:hypothetical protein
MELTKLQEITLTYLKSNGFNYLAKEKDGRIYAYKNIPTKNGKAWCSARLDGLTLVHTDFPFISFDDDRPYYILEKYNIQGD